MNETLKDLRESANKTCAEVAQAIAACMEERRQQENGARSYEQEGGNV